MKTRLASVQRSFEYFLLLLCSAVLCVAGDGRAVGYVRVSGLCGAVLSSMDVVQLSDAINSDIDAILLNASSSTASLNIDVAMIEQTISALDIDSLGNVRFSFIVDSVTDISAIVALQWSTHLADLARQQVSIGLFPMLATLYESTRSTTSASMASATMAYCNFSDAGNVTIAVVSGACTLEATTAAASEDKCGPFSCFGFAMVALLCFLLLAVGIALYCCTRWRSRKELTVTLDRSETKIVDSAEINVVVDAVNIANDGKPTDDDTDDDPFEDFEEAKVPPPPRVVPPPQRSSIIAPASPPRGPLAELNREPASPMRSLTQTQFSRPASRNVSPSPRRPSVVKIREPHETVATPPTTVVLPRALSGNRLTNIAASRPGVQSHNARSPTTAEPSLDEEKKRLESQPWIWKHVH